ncbi:hypothetical protein [Tepidibacillus sp. HK-1]|uniref:hypothetical protein n=1 Tax=Tepidibacillus sp. HK-1 TaxID=1883407 RepID=UPI000852DBBE|nr:hypothetical protein [Tepidibacillus sp. HK-1]GBF11862.1 hypothetical protein HK1_01901 [Tepidibacillus sp. HK-1]
MSSQINRQKALNLAREYGLSVSFDNTNPGVEVYVNNIIEHHKFKSFFPEFNNSINGINFITKDTSELKSIAKEMNIVFKKATTTIIINSNQIDLYKNEKWSGAA